MKSEEIKKLRNDIGTTKTNLARMEKLLETEERNCPHSWSKPAYVPEFIKGYYSPPRGQGSDFEGGFDVPDKTIEKWTRVCKLCGKSETTTKTEIQGKKIPVF